MAQIVPTQEAPSEEVSYSLAGAEFALNAGGSYETDDRSVLAEAEAYPWLAVEYDEEEAGVGTYSDHGVKPEDDGLSAVNSEAFDPEAVKRDREAVLGSESDGGGLAVEAGKDQTEEVYEGGFGRTLASDTTDEKDED